MNLEKKLVHVSYSCKSLITQNLRSMYCIENYRFVVYFILTDMEIKCQETKRNRFSTFLFSILTQTFKNITNQTLEQCLIDNKVKYCDFLSVIQILNFHLFI